MTDAEPETIVRWRFPGDTMPRKIVNPDAVEYTDSWVRIADGGHVRRINSAVPVMIETKGAGDE